MAMRLYSKEELEAELRKKWHLEPTQHYINTARAWRTPSGNHVLVPILSKGECYADHILNRIEEQLTKFGENPFV